MFQNNFDTNVIHKMSRISILQSLTDANYVISLDNDLLDLMKANNETSKEFQRRYPMLKVITPAALLAELRMR